MRRKSKTKKELFKADISRLREIAFHHALFYEYLEQNRQILNTSDGRIKRSKRYKSVIKFRNKRKGFEYYNKARRIYSAWKYLNFDLIKASKMYQYFLDQKIEQVKSMNLNLKLTGNELNWETLVIYTPKSKHLKNVGYRYYQNAALNIEAA